MCFHRGGNFIRINGWSIYSKLQLHQGPLPIRDFPVAMFFFMHRYLAYTHTIPTCESPPVQCMEDLPTSWHHHRNLPSTCSTQLQGGAPKLAKLVQITSTSLCFMVDLYYSYVFLNQRSHHWGFMVLITVIRWDLPTTTRVSHQQRIGGSSTEATGFYWIFRRDLRNLGGSYNIWGSPNHPKL